MPSLCQIYSNLARIKTLIDHQNHLSQRTARVGTGSSYIQYESESDGAMKSSTFEFRRSTGTVNAINVKNVFSHFAETLVNARVTRENGSFCVSNKNLATLLLFKRNRHIFC